jgi:type IV pilus assembly protein PilB
VRLVNAILLNAIKKGASDIHVEPYEKKLPRALPHRRRAHRRDAAAAQAQERPREPPQDHVVARHRRAPPAPGRPHQAQDGQGQEMDFRVSVLPTIWGEKIVLRLLDKSNLQLDMTKLGFDKKPLEDFKWAITSPGAWCS